MKRIFSIAQSIVESEADAYIGPDDLPGFSNLCKVEIKFPKDLEGPLNTLASLQAKGMDVYGHALTDAVALPWRKNGEPQGESSIEVRIVAKNNRKSCVWGNYQKRFGRALWKGRYKLSPVMEVLMRHDPINSMLQSVLSRLIIASWEAKIEFEKK